MKLVVIGFGQCGGRIADEFARLNKRARRHRRIEIIPNAFAVNTDVADLSGLSCIKSDYQHRILIGNRKTGGHGVGKINERAAEIARDDSDKIIDAMRSARRFYETDAFLLIAGAAGGTGSGATPIIAKKLKDRFPHKPVYTLIVLPFENEEEREVRTNYNTATCLKAIYPVSDAVFLIDNQRYIQKDSSLSNNVNAINKLIAEPFYDLLCAGEVKKAKQVGVRVLDGGDIIATLSGLTTLGYGVTQLSTIRLPFARVRDFRKKSTETHKGIQAMDEALSNLSIECDPKDSGNALYLVSAPRGEMSMDLVNELSEYLSEVAPEAGVRYGDYPRGEATLKVTIILSKLKRVDKVRQYYENTPVFIQKDKEGHKRYEAEIDELINASAAVPSLFGDDGN
jgi:cell division GTPase FtsZ